MNEKREAWLIYYHQIFIGFEKKILVFLTFSSCFLKKNSALPKQIF